MADAYSLRGKVALVTGVSRRIGIGAAIAHELATGGADIFTTYFRPYDAGMPWGDDPTDAEGIIDELGTLGVRAAGMELDLADSGAAPRLFERAETALGPVDILVNNAAHSTPDGITALDATGLDRHYAVNLRALALLCAEFVRRRRDRPGGRIINVTSGQGTTPMPGELAYAATKGAVDAFTVSLSAALAARGITVNAVDPGPTDTGWMAPSVRQALAAHAPAGRVGAPEDVARVIRFLAADEAAWVTGQIIRSRGGL